MSAKDKKVLGDTVRDQLAIATSGDRTAMAQLLSLVEKGGEISDLVQRALKGTSKNAYIIGITGAPGAGKSALIGALIQVLREENERVAVLAVDPSSPFSHGALLGDRLRMGTGKRDEDVFIRSMASRGSRGGLAASTQIATTVLDAGGWSWIIIETVGAGQLEIDIAGLADATIVVLNPGGGDEIQAQKAGLMEVGDLFVINKADRPGVANARRYIEMMLSSKSENHERPSVLETVATNGRGLPELWQAIKEFRKRQEASGLLDARRHNRIVYRLKRALLTLYEARLAELIESPEFAREVTLLTEGKTTIPDSVSKLLGNQRPL